MSRKADRPVFPVKLFVFQFVPVFMLLLLLFYAAGPPAARMLLPAMEREMRILRPHYGIKLSYAEPAKIDYEIGIPFVWTDQSGNRRDGIVKSGRLPASNVAIHPVLVFSILLAWPPVPWRRKGTLVLVSLPFLFIVELLDLPLHILWNAERGIPLETVSAGLIHFWGQVLSNGGKQFLSLVAVFLSLGTYTLMERNKGGAADVQAGRNDPCPCGSGKKFKNCCME